MAHAPGVLRTEGRRQGERHDDGLMELGRLGGLRVALGQRREEEVRWPEVAHMPAMNFGDFSQLSELEKKGKR